VARSLYYATGTKAAKTIAKLRTAFVCFGLPETLITDNGPPFNNAEFEIFCKSNEINLKHSPPYHPPSNGAIEKQVNTIKNNLKKQLFENNKTTPNSITKKSPAEMIFQQLPKKKITMLKPNTLSNKKDRRYRARVENYENTTRQDLKVFTEREIVWVYDTRERNWFAGKVMKNVSRCTYLVLTCGRIRFVHAVNLKANTVL
jgi:transposase InsO family protein